jgi:hypothetical protein
MESRKRIRGQAQKDRKCNKRSRNEEADKVLDVKKAMVHLETPFLHNCYPTNERKAALSRFTGLDIYAVDEWFNQRAMSGPAGMTAWLSALGPSRRSSTPNELAKNDQDMAYDRNTTLGSQMKGKKIAADTETAAVHENDNHIIKHYSFLGLKMDICKLYSCTKGTCSMKFKSKSNWKRHEETHYPQSGYICLLLPKCKSKIFPRKDKFLEHLKRVHDSHLYTAEVRQWQKLIADLTAWDYPVCSLSFSSWSGRCDHIAKMIEGSRKLLIEERTNLNTYPRTNKQSTKDQRYQLSRQEPEIVTVDNHRN